MSKGQRLVVAAAFAILVFHAPAGFAEDAPPPIRAFDIPTVEKLGRDIYEQDRWAWVATDVLRAAHSDSELKDQKIRGWIVDKSPDGAVVRFIHDTDNGPELFYDVRFVGSASPQLSTPQDRTLSSDDLAQYNARTLALKNVDRKCEELFNTVVLKDPERDGLLVWIMSGTTDPDKIIIGGHHRFMVSKDGKTILQKDALSRSCLSFSRREGTKGLKPGEPPNLFFGQLVSAAPLETTVFANLSYGFPFHFGTPDGKAWRVDQGRLTTIEQDEPGMEGFVARAIAAQQEICITFARDTRAPNSDLQSFPTDSIISATEDDKPFHVSVPQGYTAVSIMCGRYSLVPAPNDYKVLLAGYTLSIADNSVPSQPIGTLEINGGQFRYRLLKGNLSDETLAARIGKRLDEFQIATRKGK
ncbi:MAG: hypothetical protein HY243_05290 [Proteobacteria bacterium]|nr:hypothetical protein [Pseudomonadota bacterium]